MVTTHKRGGETEFSDTILGGTFIILGRTSQIGATRLIVSLTPADALTHVLPGYAGVGAGVVCLATNDQTVLV